MNEIKHIHESIGQSQDSLEIGTPSKGGTIKIYGDFNKKDEFKVKIDAAIELRSYTQTELGKV